MSGVLGGLQRGVSVVAGVSQSLNNLSGLLSGGGVAPGPGGVVIGGVQLQDFEVPDVIRWGTKQVVKEHVFPGGQNQFQAMGPTRTPIAWSGQMLSPNATDRARMLDALASTGSIVTLAWGDLNFDVIVEYFEAEYKHQWWTGRYEIRCLVQWDYGEQDDEPDALTATGNDLSDALGTVSDGLSQVAQTVSGVIQTGQQVLGAVSSVVTPITSALGISVPFLGAAQGFLATAQAGVNGVASLGSAIGGLADAAGGIQNALYGLGQGVASTGAVLAGLGPVGPGNVLAGMSAMGGSAVMASAWGYTARAADNFGTVPGASTPNVIPAGSAAANALDANLGSNVSGTFPDGTTFVAGPAYTVPQQPPDLGNYGP